MSGFAPAVPPPLFDKVFNITGDMSVTCDTLLFYTHSYIRILFWTQISGSPTYTFALHEILNDGSDINIFGSANHSATFDAVVGNCAGSLTPYLPNIGYIVFTVSAGTTPSGTVRIIIYGESDV